MTAKEAARRGLPVLARIASFATAGVDPALMPGKLETVRASVARTAEMLGYLVWHASRDDKEA